MSAAVRDAVGGGLPKEHYAWLDWLRFGAAMAVVICHVRGGHWMDYGRLAEESKGILSSVFFAVTRPNFEPVVVFFVLSGFLVGGKVIERLMSGTFRPVDYALDRFSRIYLPLVPALILSVAVAWWIGRPATLAVIAGNIASLQGVAVRTLPANAPLWSLSYEVWFYVIAGALAATFALVGRARLVALAVLAVALVIYSHLAAALLFCWLLGAAAFPLRKASIPRTVLVFAFLLFVLGAGASQAAMISQSIKLPSLPLPDRYASAMVMSAGLAVLVAWLSSRPVRTDAGLRLQAVGTYLAGFSYTLYLTHYPLLELWNHYNPQRIAVIDGNSLLLFVGKIVGCVAIAWVLYLPFEARTAEFRRWLRGTTAGGMRHEV